MQMGDSAATDEKDGQDEGAADSGATETDRAEDDEVETESGDDPEEIEAERKERLDPDNRPDTAEVDNTQRDFDAEKGTFTDTDDYEEVEPKFVADEDL
jgi:hypothetical protein